MSSLRLLDLEADPSLDRLVRIAASSLKAPIALVTLLSRDWQFNKARVGLDSPQTALADAFCVCALDSPELLEVADARIDARFATSSLVTGPPWVRSYAGHPIVFEGVVLGTVCVLDRVPRRFSNRERAVLKDLSGLASDLVQVRKERLFREREEQRAFECAAAADEWLWETDSQHRFAWLAGSYGSDAGRLAADTLGQPLIDRPLLDWFGNRRQPAMAISALFETGEAFKEALTAVGETDSERLVERSATPFFDSQDAFAGYRGTSRDVTERVRAEVRALEFDAAIRASESKSEFLSRVSHELRTPLNAVLGFAQLLLMESPGTPAIAASQRRQIEHIQAAGHQLLSLINDMLDLAAIERGTLQLQTVNVDLHAAVLNASELLQPMAAQKNIDIRNLLQPHSLFVLADSRALTQVILNLLNNAIKYNRPSGLVTVSAQSIDSVVHVIVEDNGSGISEKGMTELFQPFRRFSAPANAIEGSGLGLVICKTLVEQMQGTLSIESVENVGTSVELRLALAAPSPTVDAEVDADDGEPAAPESKGGIRTVLYIEDNAVNVILMQQLLATEPELRLLTAHDGASGIAVARTQRPSAIMIDLHLPDMSGLDVLNALRDEQLMPPCGCIVLSADAMGEHIQLALDAGFREYWTKPIDLKQVILRLNQLLDGEASAGEQ